MRLKEARQAANMTQEQVAKAIGIPKKTYQNYELGYRDPGSDVLVQIADCLNVSIDWLLGVNEQPQNGGSSPHNGFSIVDPKRQRMIDIYDAMTPQGRALMLSMAEDMLPYFKK